MLLFPQRCIRDSNTESISAWRFSKPLGYHYHNAPNRSRRFMTAPILSMIFQIHFWDQSSRFSNSFVGFGQIYSVYTGKVFLGTSCLVGIAWYANPNISLPYFIFAASLDFENITPIQTTSWKTIKPYEVIIIKTPSLSRYCHLCLPAIAENIKHHLLLTGF